MLRVPTETDDAEAASADWLRRFHEGDKTVIEQLYREHFQTVARAAGALAPADRETVIHEVFLRLLTQPPLRAGFRGGSFAAWLTVVARNHARDALRRRNRELPAGLTQEGEVPVAAHESGLQARVLIEQFRREVLPAKWAGVFEARFLEQLSQSEAAASLGIRRTTLAYQEARIRLLLRRFILKGQR